MKKLFKFSLIFKCEYSVFEDQIQVQAFANFDVLDV